MNDGSCDGCRSSYNAGHSYCVKCGRPIVREAYAAADGTECDGCKAGSGAGHLYCVKCGKPIVRPPVPEAPKEEGLRKLVSMVGLIAVAACTAMLFFEIFAVFWTMGGIWSGMEGYRIGIIFLVPFPVILFYVGGIVAKFYYLFLVFAVLVSFVLLIVNSREGISRIFSGRLDKLDDMPLYGVVTMFAMYISISMMLILLVTAVGYDPAVPDDPVEEWMLWFALLEASVWEEVLCRVLMIGVPLMLFGMYMKQNDSWKLLFGHSEINRFSVVLIILSAAIFAAAHIGGWDLFKVIPTFVCGLALGYLFVRYGLYAAIMLHFLVDYMSSVVWVFGASAATDEFISSAELMLVMFMLFIVVLGIPFIVRYAKRGFIAMKRLFSE